jgi:hypothetical protein
MGRRSIPRSRQSRRCNPRKVEDITPRFR